MRAAGAGRIVVTGSIAGNMPGPFDLAYNSTNAFLNDFCVGLAEELKDSPVVVSCLLPGATNTPFFAKAGMEETLVARGPKADPARVARDGYRALLAGETQRVSGLVGTLEHFFADLLPDELVAKLHRAMAGPDPLAATTPADKARNAG
jgi:short-subunit dehydrogenase